MLRQALLVYAVLGVSALGFPFERQLRTLETSQRIIEATDGGNPEVLQTLAKTILSQREDYNANDFGYLLSNCAGSLQRLTGANTSVNSNAYYFGRAAREALLNTHVAYASTAFIRHRWVPERYNTSLDDRAFVAARLEEADLWSRQWRRVEDALQAADAAGPPAFTANQLSTDPEERARVKEQFEASAIWHNLHRDQPNFARTAAAVMGSWYQQVPVDFDELRGLVEHHMNGSRVTNAWDSIVAQLPEKYRRQAAVAYAKPPVLAARHNLLPPVVAPARGEPGLPAIARPSKLRDSMGVRGGPSAGTAESGGKSVAVVESAGGGAGQAGGRPLWHWLGLAGAVVAGGWVWLKTR